MATVNEAKKTLQEGGILLYPTDTVWGLGCDATDEKAVQRIAELKGRSSDKSFIVLVNSFHMLEKYVPDFPEICYDLIDLSERPLT
ncbi:L-threonylcarbamoyladenylate synthase, partial [Lishizhenia sp.]|uniref:L-threonylcarbamoyladenylate synthase n=1 Tax=Lishizhenia sp. TaxID=2497594 RepID=UPI00299DF33D